MDKDKTVLEIPDNNTYIIKYSFDDNSAEGIKHSEGTKLLNDNYLKKTFVAGALCTIIVSGGAASNGNAPSFSSPVQTIAPSPLHSNLASNSQVKNTARKKKMDDYITNFYSYSTQINSMMISTDFDFEAYNDGEVNHNNMEDFEMDNQYFDVMSDRLYKIGFSVFGIASILLLSSWALGFIASEIGLIGSVMCIASTTALAGLRFLFRRAFECN